MSFFKSFANLSGFLYFKRDCSTIDMSHGIGSFVT